MIFRSAQNEATMLIAGIDVGSANTKVVIYNPTTDQLLTSAVNRTGMQPRLAAERTLNQALNQAQLSRTHINRIIATGYARHTINFADAHVTEITATARAIRHWHPECRTIIDIGGQDSKVISLNSEGQIQDFIMNDRCAAGTGSFLEFIARSLDIPIENFGILSARSQQPVIISSLCVVMAETEILSLVAADTPREDIIAGLHQALAQRVAALAARLPVETEIIFTGGTAQNTGMQTALARALKLPVQTARFPLLAAAFGAALGD